MDLVQLLGMVKEAWDLWGRGHGWLKRGKETATRGVHHKSDWGFLLSLNISSGNCCLVGLGLVTTHLGERRAILRLPFLNEKLCRHRVLGATALGVGRAGRIALLVEGSWRARDAVTPRPARDEGRRQHLIFSPDVLVNKSMTGFCVTLGIPGPFQPCSVYLSLTLEIETIASRAN